MRLKTKAVVSNPIAHQLATRFESLSKNKHKGFFAMYFKLEKTL
jgi:hypothetical protein